MAYQRKNQGGTDIDFKQAYLPSADVQQLAAPAPASESEAINPLEYGATLSRGDFISPNYAKLQKGWRIDSDGNAEFQSLILRGLSISIGPLDDLQSAINKINAGGGGTINIAAGTYTITKSLVGVSNIIFQGSGASNTTILFSGSVGLSFTGTSIYTTGTITAIAGTAVTGNGTAWLANVTTSHQIFIGTRWYRVASITDDTHLVLAESYGDNVTLPTTYRAVKPITNIYFKNLTFTGSGGTAIAFTDCRTVSFDSVVVASSNVGIAMTNVSEVVFRVMNVVGSTSDGVQMTNVGLGNANSLQTAGNGGNGITMNNVKTFPFFFCSSTSNTGDGYNCTTVVDVLFKVEASSNGGQGIEFVSGCVNCFINDSSIRGNTSDGIKLTASSNNNTLGSALTLTNNGGYGINIAAASDNNNTVVVPYFASNTSGTITDSGTNTNTVATITKFNSGNTTHNAGSGSATQNIAHGLGVIPKAVSITCFLNLTSTFLEATTRYNGTTQSSWSFYAVSGGAFTAATTFTLNSANSNSTTVGTVTFDATNIIISWVDSGTPSGNYTLIWDAQG